MLFRSQMTTLYMDDESVMPVVLESGKIVITISNTDLKAVGTPLNTALYDFIAKKNAMEESIGELERKETRMVMDGADLEEVHEQLLAEGDSLFLACRSESADECVMVPRRITVCIVGRG